MAAKAYVQTAAAQLMQAQADAKAQVDEVARAAANERSQIEQQCNRLENELRLRQTQLATGNKTEADEADMQYVRNEMRDLGRELEQQQAALRQLEQRVASEQQSRQKAADDIGSALSAVNSVLGSPGLV